MALWRYLHEGGKRAIAIWHRRAGKDARQLLGMREVFSEELANAPVFAKQVSDTLNSFYADGARATLVKSVA